MATKTTTRAIQTQLPPTSEAELPTGLTGRYLITLTHGSQRGLIKALKNCCGISALSTADFADSKLDLETFGGADAIIFEHLSVAIFRGGDTGQLQALEMAVADDLSRVLAIEPEEYVQAISDEGHLTSSGRDYLRGFRDGTAELASRLLGVTGQEPPGESGPAETYFDSPQFTWGLQATRVHSSSATGTGLRIAVLDTGFDLGHPDFANRQVISETFTGQPVQDGHGHGTHCIGTALGDRQLANGLRRYGCARQGIILAGKVLSNSGSGSDAGVLAGIDWAIRNGARVISMSLGSPVTVGTPHKIAYEQVGRAALSAGSLIIAAAGNSGNHPTMFPVGSPANAPSILAVAAVDQNLRRASFSCRAANPSGGEVNIAGPGVNVFSSVPMSARYGSMSGTSMATPHVAGIAAMWSQRTGERGTALWQRLEKTARNLAQPVEHVGRGLVQAPQ
jgi:subtilisin